MRLIGINGFKHSGKGATGLAIADCLAQAPHFQTTKLLGFADKLKILGARTLGFTTLPDEECIALMDECKETWEFAISRWRLEEPESEFPSIRNVRDVVTTITGRQYLQHLGTEARKVFGEDFWVDQVLPRPAGLLESCSHRLAERYSSEHCVAFTDLRFENEAQRILDLGGEVWEVVRPGTESDGHDSEQVLPRELISRQIDNSGDLMALRYEVEKALGL